MKGTTVILDRIAGRMVAARLVDGALDDLLVAPPDGWPVTGAIHRAVVDRPMKGQGGVTVRLDQGNGFLRQAKGLRPGQGVLVQVTGHAEPCKAVPVTARLLFRSRYAIVTPGAPGINVARAIADEARRVELLTLAHDVAGDLGDAGLILRSATEAASDDEISDDIVQALELARGVMQDDGEGPALLVDGPDPHTAAWRDWPAPDALVTAPGGLEAHGVDAMIDALGQARVDLPGGAWISVEPTSALVAVDVNTGSDSSLAAGLKANLAAARALPRALRLRGLGGQVTVDAAPMPKKDRRVFEQVLRAALKADPVDTVMAGWTPLGCYELQRRRDRIPLPLCLAGLARG